MRRRLDLREARLTSPSAFTCPTSAYTARDVPDSCKSRDSAIVCGPCLTALADQFAAAAGPGGDICSVTSGDVSRCLGPRLGVFSAAGANLNALISCDQAAATSKCAHLKGIRPPALDARLRSPRIQAEAEVWLQVKTPSSIQGHQSVISRQSSVPCSEIQLVSTSPSAL